MPPAIEQFRHVIFLRIGRLRPADADRPLHRALPR
jgi:hypothetical protein